MTPYGTPWRMCGVFFSSLFNIRGNTPLPTRPKRRNIHPISDKNGKIYTPFQTRNALKWYPSGWHIKYLYGLYMGVPPPPLPLHPPPSPLPPPPPPGLYVMGSMEGRRMAISLQFFKFLGIHLIRHADSFCRFFFCPCVLFFKWAAKYGQNCMEIPPPPLSLSVCLQTM